MDLQRVKDKSVLKPKNLPELQAKIQEAIRQHESTQKVIVKGIQLRGERLKIIARNTQEVRALQNSEEWISSAFAEARILGEEWYPVKIDDACRYAVLEEGSELRIKQGFLEEFARHNETGPVKKVIWLSKGNKATGSMGVFLERKEDAERLLGKRLVYVGGQVAFSDKFERLARPMRCFNCQQYGHSQAMCKNDSTCGRCAGGHSTDSCISPDRRCAACKEPHAATDRGCPAWRKEMERLKQERQKQGTSPPRR